MTPVAAPAVASVAGTGVPAGAALPSRMPAPRVAFRSVLLGKDTSAPDASTETAMHSTPLLVRAPFVEDATTRSLLHARHPDSATATLPQQGQRLDEDRPLPPLRRHRAPVDPTESLACPVPLARCESVAVSTAAGSAAVCARAASTLEDLIPTLVRRIAWSGDRQRGTVRIELGAGELAGAMLLVHAEDGRVRVHLDVPPGVDPRQWQRRICDRLATRGLVTDSVDVT